MTLVDANVLLDVLTDDPKWRVWSEERLLIAAGEGDVAMNPIIYAEVAVGFRRPVEADRALAELGLRRLPLPYEAAFLAGQAFLRYRREGGARRSPLPDFYIGAHAQHDGLQLLTRDAARYRTYFPEGSSDHARATG